MPQPRYGQQVSTEDLYDNNKEIQNQEYNIDPKTDYAKSIESSARYGVSQGDPVGDAFAPYGGVKGVDENLGVEDLYNIPETRAQEQSGWDRFGNFAANMAIEAGLGSAEAVTYMADMINYEGLEKEAEDGFDSEYGKYFREVKEQAQENFPIYMTAKAQHGTLLEKMSEGSYWASQGKTVGTTLSLMLPGLGIAKGVGTGAKMLGAGLRASQAIGGAAAGLSSRMAESAMEANQQFQQNYSKYLAEEQTKGTEDEEAETIARQRAGNIAANTFKGNMYLAPLDMLQYGLALNPNLLKAFNNLKKGIPGVVNAGIQMGSEAAEEGFQYVAGQEAISAEEKGTDFLGGEGFNDRLAEYVEEPEFQESALLGGLMGGLFEGIGKLSKAQNFVTDKIEAVKTKNEIKSGELDRDKLISDIGAGIDGDILDKQRSRYTSVIDTKLGQEDIDTDLKSSIEGNSKIINGAFDYAQTESNNLESDPKFKNNPELRKELLKTKVASKVNQDYLKKLTNDVSELKSTLTEDIGADGVKVLENEAGIETAQELINEIKKDKKLTAEKKKEQIATLEVKKNRVETANKELKKENPELTTTSSYSDQYKKYQKSFNKTKYNEDVKIKPTIAALESMGAVKASEAEESLRKESSTNRNKKATSRIKSNEDSEIVKSDFIKEGGTEKEFNKLVNDIAAKEVTPELTEEDFSEYTPYEQKQLTSLKLNLEKQSVDKLFEHYKKQEKNNKKLKSNSRQYNQINNGNLSLDERESLGSIMKYNDVKLKLIENAILSHKDLYNSPEIEQTIQQNASKDNAEYQELLDDLSTQRFGTKEDQLNIAINKVKDKYNTVKNDLSSEEDKLLFLEGLLQEIIPTIGNKADDITKNITRLNSLIDSNSKKLSKKGTTTQNLIQEFKEKLNSEGLLYNDISNRIKEVKEGITLLTSMSDDLQNQEDYYNNLKANSNISRLTKISVNNEIKKISKKKGILEKIIDKLNKVLKNGIEALQAYVNSTGNLINFLTGLKTVSTKEGKVSITNMASINKNVDVIEKEIQSSLNNVKVLEDKNNKTQEEINILINKVLNYQNNIRYLNDLLEGDLIGLAETEVNNIPEPVQEKITNITTKSKKPINSKIKKILPKKLSSLGSKRYKEAPISFKPDMERLANTLDKSPEGKLVAENIRQARTPEEFDSIIDTINNEGTDEFKKLFKTIIRNFYNNKQKSKQTPDPIKPENIGNKGATDSEQNIEEKIHNTQSVPLREQETLEVRALQYVPKDGSIELDEGKPKLDTWFERTFGESINYDVQDKLKIGDELSLEVPFDNLTRGYTSENNIPILIKKDGEIVGYLPASGSKNVQPNMESTIAKIRKKVYSGIDLANETQKSFKTVVTHKTGGVYLPYKTSRFTPVKHDGQYALGVVGYTKNYFTDAASKIIEKAGINLNAIPVGKVFQIVQDLSGKYVVHSLYTESLEKNLVAYNRYVNFLSKLPKETNPTVIKVTKEAMLGIAATPDVPRLSKKKDHIVLTVNSLTDKMQDKLSAEGINFRIVNKQLAKNKNVDVYEVSIPLDKLDSYLKDEEFNAVTDLIKSLERQVDVKQFNSPRYVDSILKGDPDSATDRPTLISRNNPDKIFGNSTFFINDIIDGTPIDPKKVTKSENSDKKKVSDEPLTADNQKPVEGSVEPKKANIFNKVLRLYYGDFIYETSKDIKGKKIVLNYNQQKLVDLVQSLGLASIPASAVNSRMISVVEFRSENSMTSLHEFINKKLNKSLNTSFPEWVELVKNNRSLNKEVMNAGYNINDGTATLAEGLDFYDAWVANKVELTQLTSEILNTLFNELAIDFSINPKEANEKNTKALDDYSDKGTVDNLIANLKHQSVKLSEYLKSENLTLDEFIENINDYIKASNKELTTLESSNNNVEELLEDRSIDEARQKKIEDKLAGNRAEIQLLYEKLNNLPTNSPNKKSILDKIEKLESNVLGRFEKANLASELEAVKSRISKINVLLANEGLGADTPQATVLNTETVEEVTLEEKPVEKPSIDEVEEELDINGFDIGELGLEGYSVVESPAPKTSRPQQKKQSNSVIGKVYPDGRNLSVKAIEFTGFAEIKPDLANDEFGQPGKDSVKITFENGSNIEVGPEDLDPEYFSGEEADFIMRALLEADNTPKETLPEDPNDLTPSNDGTYFRLNYTEGYEQWDKTKETKYLKDKLGRIQFESITEENSVKNDIEALVPKGANVWGYVKNAVIYLSETAGKGTAYHEAFHIVSKYMLNDKQRLALYNEAKKEFGNLSDKLLEERLADKFMDYVESEGTDTSVKGRIKTFFSRLYTWVKYKLGGNLSIDEVFYAIDKGVFKSQEPKPSNNSKFKEPVFKRIANFSPDKQEKATEMLSTMWSRVIDKQIETNPKFKNSRRIDVVNALGTDILAKLVMREIVIHKTKIVAEGNVNASDLDVIFAKWYNHKSKTFGDLGELAFRKIKDREGYKINVKAKFKLANTEGNSEQKQTEDETQLEGWQIDVQSTSGESGLSHEIRSLLYTLPMTINGTKYGDKYWGYQTNVNGKQAYDFLSRNLADIFNIDVMMEKLNELSLQSDKEFTKEVVQRLDADSTLKTQFYNNMAMTHAEMGVMQNFYGEWRYYAGNRNSVDKMIISEWETSANNSWMKTGKPELKQLPEINTIQEAVKVFNSIGLELKESDFGGKIGKKERFTLAKNDINYIIKGLNAGNNVFEDNISNFNNLGYVIKDNRLGLVESSYVGADGKKKYSINIPSFFAKQLYNIKQGNLEMYKSDPFYSESPMFKDLLDNTGNILDTLDYSLMDGLKYSQKKDGIPYNKMTKKDFEIYKINAYHNNGKKVGLFSMPILSDSPSSISIKLPKLNTNLVFDKLTEVAFQEYYRIQQLEQGIKDKKIKNYDDNYNKFHFFPFLTQADFVGGATKDEIKIKLIQALDKKFNTYKEFITDENVLNKEDNYGISSDAVDNQSEDSFLLDYYLNDYYYRTQLITMTTGDPSFYKNATDFFKRAKEIWSPGLVLNTSAEFTTEAGDVIQTGKTFNSVYLTDVEEFMEELGTQVFDILSNKAATPDQQMRAAKIAAAYGYSNRIENEGTEEEKRFVDIEVELDGKKKKVSFQSKKVNVADAQAFISPNRYRKVQIGLGRWTNNLNSVLDKLIGKEKLSFEDTASVMMPLKPFYFGHIKSGNKVIPVQNKNSEYMLLSELVERSPRLKSMYEKMTINNSGNNIDSFQFESAIKAGLSNDISIDNLGELTVDNIHVLNNADYSLQQETPEHYVDANNLYGTQYRKLLLADIDPNATFDVDGKTYTRDELVNEYQELIIANLAESYENSHKELGFDLAGRKERNKMLSDMLVKEVQAKEYGNDIEEAVSLDENGEFNLPLFDTLHSDRIEKMLTSIYRNNVTKQKIKGGSFVQASNIGFMDELQLKISDGRLEYAEVYLPEWTREYFADGDITNIPEELRDMIGYRIPTEDKYSMLPLRVKGFLPSNAGGAIMLPSAITTMAGSDFDVDKLYVLMPEFKVHRTLDYKKVVRELAEYGISTTFGEVKEIYDKLKNKDTDFTDRQNDIYQEIEELPKAKKDELTFKKYLVKIEGKTDNLYTTETKQTEVKNSNSLNAKKILPFEDFKITSSDTLNNFLEFLYKSQDEAKIDIPAKKLTSQDKQILAKAIGRSYKNINDFDWYEALYSDTGKEEVFYYLTTGNNLDKDTEVKYSKSTTLAEYNTFIQENKEFVDGYKDLPSDIKKELKKDYDKIIEKYDWYRIKLMDAEYDSRKELLKQVDYTEEDYLQEEEEVISKESTDTVVLNKEVLGDWSSAQRNNRLLDIGKAILTHQDTFGKTMKPGGFEDYQRYANIVSVLRDSKVKYSFKDLNEMSDKKLGDLAQDVLDKKDDITVADPLSQIKMFHRNMSGAALIGIFANHNVNHSVLQFTDAEFDTPFLFDGKPYSQLNQAYIDGNRVMESVAQLLAASVDNAKDPNAFKANISTITADIAATMLRLGIPMETMIGFMGQPVIAHYLKLIDKYGGNFAAQDKAKREILEVLGKQKQSNINTTDLYNSLKDKWDSGIQNHVFNNFLLYQDLSNDLATVIRATRADATGAGPKLANNEKYIEDMDKARTVESIKGLTDLWNGSVYPMVKSFYDLGIAKPNVDMNKLFWYDHPVIKGVKDEVRDKTGANLSPDDLDKLNSHIYTYFMSNCDILPFNDRDMAKKIIYDTPALLEKLKAKYANKYKVLKYLKVKNDKKSPFARIEFNALTSVTPTLIDELKSSFMDMFYEKEVDVKDGKSDVRKLAENLLLYTYFRMGSVYGGNSFANVIPTEFYLKDTDGRRIREYKMQLDPETSGNFIKSEDYANFADQFIRNNWMNGKYVPKISTDLSEVQQRELSASNVPYWVKVNSKKGNFINGEVGGVPQFKSYLSYPVVTVKGKKTSVEWVLMKLVNSSGGAAVYSPYNGLGHPATLVEYNMSGINESMVASNNVNKEIINKGFGLAKSLNLSTKLDNINTQKDIDNLKCVTGK